MQKFSIWTLNLFMIATLSAHSRVDYRKETQRWPSFTSIHKNLDAAYATAYDEAKALVHYRKVPRIPKILHQIWLGSPVPHEFYPLIESWLTQHPDWEYKLWTDKEIEKLHLVNQHVYALADNYGMQSDIARLEILYRFGGLYADLDQQCVLPHDIFHHITDFYIGLVDTTLLPKRAISNALIGAATNHPLLEKAIEHIQNSHKTLKNRKQMTPQTTMRYTGPYLLGQITHDYLMRRPPSHPLCLVLPKPFFSPLPCKKCPLLELSPLLSTMKPYTYAIHYHTCTWQEASGHIASSTP